MTRNFTGGWEQHNHESQGLRLQKHRGMRVGGQTVGVIQVTTLEDGSIEGELKFRNPFEPGKVLLDFDPRGQNIEVMDGSAVIPETPFPE